MAPRFRIYQKKRGNRRTGSKTLGSIGEAVFFAALFALGCGLLALIFATLVVPEYRANHAFVEHQCTVLDKRLARKEAAEGVLFRPEIRIQYEVEGKTFVDWTYDIRRAFSAGEEQNQEVLDRFTPGEHRACWYDPADPNVVVLERGYSWWFWLTLLVPVSFVLTGGGGLIYTIFTWGKSAERRAVITRRAAQLKLFEGRKGRKSEFPNVPSPANMTISPGTHLAYRLPVVASPGWKLAVWLGVCLGWNGIVAIFAVWAVAGHLSGSPDWTLTAFTTPFALAGIGLIVVLVRQVLLTTGIGPTLVEISDQPLQPGRTYELFLSQSGRLAMKSLEVLLVCEEEATFRHGTDTRTERHRVFQHAVFRQEGFPARQGASFEAQFSLEVPAGAMHSFHSDHNEVNWKLIVRGEVAGWPGYERSFPIIVYPGTNGLDPNDPDRHAASQTRTQGNGTSGNE